MPSNPSRVIVQLGANVEQLVAGMNQAISAIKGSTSQITGQLKTVSEGSEKMRAEMVRGFEGAALSARNLLGPLASLFTVYQAFGTVKGFVSLGIETNAAMESATQGIAGLILAQGTLHSSRKELLTGERAYAAAMALSSDQVQKLRVDGLQTAATTLQLTDAFKSATAAGLAAGLNLDQIRQITVRITQAAGAMNVPMDQLRQEVVSILRATIDRNSVVAKNLNLTNEEVKAWREGGQLFDRIMEKTQAFGVIGAKSLTTYSALLSNIRDAVAIMAGTVTMPLFESLKGSMGDIFGTLFDQRTANLALPMTGLVESLKGLFGGIGDAIRSWVGAALDGLRQLSGWLAENRDKVAAFGAAVGAVATAWTGALGSMLGAMASVAAAGIGPLTTALNAVAAVLSTGTAQVALFGVVALNAIPRLVSLAGSVLGMLNPIMAVSRAASGLGTAFEAAGMARAASSMHSAAGAAGTLAGSVASLLNPWVLIAAAIGGAVLALNMWINASQRAAEQRLKEARAGEADLQKYKRLSEEAVALEKIMNDSTETEDRRIQAANRLRDVLSQINTLMPGLNASMSEEGGIHRDVAEQLKNKTKSLEESLRAEIAIQQRRVDAQAAEAAQYKKSAESYAGQPEESYFQRRFEKETAALKTETQALDALKDKLATITTKPEPSEVMPKYTPYTTPEDPEGKDGARKVLEAWREELEQMRADQARTHDLTNVEELAFWRSKLAIAKKGTEEYRQVLSLVNRSLIAVGKDEREAAAKAAKEQSEAERRRLEEERRRAAEEAKLKLDQIKADETYAVRDIEIEERHWRALYDAGEMGQAEYIDGLLTFEDQKFEIQLAALDEQAYLYISDIKLFQEYLEKRALLIQGHRGKKAEIDDMALGRRESGVPGADNRPIGKQLTSGIEGAVMGMADTWATGLQKMLRGQISFSQAIKGFWKSLADGIIGEMLRILMRWVITKTLELIFHRNAENAKQALTKQTGQVQQTTAIQSAATTAVTASAEVGSKGAAAAAGGAQSVASVPYVGPILAIAAIAAILGAVLALRSNIRSAAGGFDIPPGLAPLTQLHPEEMVLPADLAGKIRAITAPAGESFQPAGGGGGGAAAIRQGDTYNIMAMDGLDVERVLMRHRDKLAKVNRMTHREGRYRR